MSGGADGVAIRRPPRLVVELSVASLGSVRTARSSDALYFQHPGVEAVLVIRVTATLAAVAVLWMREGPGIVVRQAVVFGRPGNDQDQLMHAFQQDPGAPGVLPAVQAGGWTACTPAAPVNWAAPYPVPAVLSRAASCWAAPWCTMCLCLWPAWAT